MIDGLQELLSKEVVIPTMTARDLACAPERVEIVYGTHLRTFSILGEADTRADRFVAAVKRGRTPLGMFTAPVGYGKTANLAFLWHACEKANLLAVPPFIFSHLSDIIEATAGWASFRLAQRYPTLLDSVARLRGDALAAGIDALAERYAREHQITRVQAKLLLDDLKSRRQLIQEVQPLDALQFLDRMVAVAHEANYDGLVILPDEVQQYLGRHQGLREILQEFREFIWGLDTREEALGIVFGVINQAEAAIASDILDRIVKRGGFYLKLNEVYGRGFARDLWRQYASAFCLGDLADRLIDDETLEAIGQIASREDLGRGPRTVIDAFQQAIRRHQTAVTAGRDPEPYTPVELMEDFLGAQIRFEHQGHKLSTVARQVLESERVDSKEKRNAVLLLGAFPLGCSEAIQRKYGLSGVVERLAMRGGHGELFINLVEGYTLNGLQRRGDGPTHIIDTLIRDFWVGFEVDEAQAQAAERAFTKHVWRQLLPRRQGPVLTGWGDIDVVEAETGAMIAVVEGSFSAQFPARRILLRSVHSPNIFPQGEPERLHIDLRLDFELQWGRDTSSDSPGSLQIEGRVATFRLNLNQRFSGGTPPDLRKLEDYVHPNFVSPFLLLSLVDYFDRSAASGTALVSEGQKQELDMFRQRLVQHALLSMFNQALTESAGASFHAVGAQLLPEVYLAICRSLWPSYRTLIVGGNYAVVMKDYVDALPHLTLAQRRGHQIIDGSKDFLAGRFGLQRWSTFETRARGDYANLMRVTETGSAARIELQLHPLELEIMAELGAQGSREAQGDQPRLSLVQVGDVGRTLGYRDEEVILALELLAARAYIRIDAATQEVVLAPAGLNKMDLLRNVESLDAQLEAMPESAWPPGERQSLAEAILDIQRALDTSPDEETLDDLQARANTVSERLSTAVASRRSRLEVELREIRNQLDRCSIHASEIEFSQAITGQLGFVQHLNEVRLILKQKQDTLRRDIRQAIGSMESRLSSGFGLDSFGVKQLQDEVDRANATLLGLRNRVDEAKQYGVLLAKWKALLAEADQLFGELAYLPEIQQKLSEDLVAEVRSAFVRRRDDTGWETALQDIEQFRNGLQEIRDEYNNVLGARNQAFGRVKDEYEQALVEARIEQRRLMCRFTFGDDAGSYHDLHEEVRSRLNDRIGHLATRMERLQVDLLKAEHIQSLDAAGKQVLEQLKTGLRDVERTTDQLRERLTIGLIREDRGVFSAYCRNLGAVDEQLEQMQLEADRFLAPDMNRTQAEDRLIRAFGSRREVDLTDIVVAELLASRDGRETALDRVIGLLRDLYRKNQLGIRIVRRA